MAPLQRRALIALLLEAIWAAAIIAVFVSQGGATRFISDSSFRLLMDGIWVGGLILYWWLFSSLDRRPSHFDERDKVIMDRSSKTQWLAVIFSLVVWVIGLSERYHAQGQIPTVFLYLIFFSTLIVGTLAQTAGILIGYWRINQSG